MAWRAGRYDGSSTFGTIKLETQSTMGGWPMIRFHLSVYRPMSFIAASFAPVCSAFGHILSRQDPCQAAS
ncbi:MAG TPA: hypothetical protein DIT99_18865 [Candidatus Latescibacteria bacterium]|nr:hypothetical protein [Candidatus Latescibacterota bacterium]